MRISLLILFVILLLPACGGGGGGGSKSKKPVIVGGPPVLLTGTATFTSYAPQTTGGLNYSSPEIKNIRGAVVEIRDANGDTVASGNTDANGDFVISVPSALTLTVLVKAAHGILADTTTRVIAGQVMPVLTRKLSNYSIADH